jgi:uncharacterized protein YhfF
MVKEEVKPKANPSIVLEKLLSVVGEKEKKALFEYFHNENYSENKFKEWLEFYLEIFPERTKLSEEEYMDNLYEYLKDNDEYTIEDIQYHRDQENRYIRLISSEGRSDREEGYYQLHLHLAIHKEKPKTISLGLVHEFRRAMRGHSRARRFMEEVENLDISPSVIEQKELDPLEYGGDLYVAYIDVSLSGDHTLPMIDDFKKVDWLIDSKSVELWDLYFKKFNETLEDIPMEKIASKNTFIIKKDTEKEISEKKKVYLNHIPMTDLHEKEYMKKLYEFLQTVGRVERSEYFEEEGEFRLGLLWGEEDYVVELTLRVDERFPKTVQLTICHEYQNSTRSEYIAKRWLEEVEEMTFEGAVINEALADDYAEDLYILRADVYLEEKPRFRMIDNLKKVDSFILEKSNELWRLYFREFNALLKRIPKEKGTVEDTLVDGTYFIRKGKAFSLPTLDTIVAKDTGVDKRLLKELLDKWREYNSETERPSFFRISNRYGWNKDDGELKDLKKVLDIYRKKGEFFTDILEEKYFQPNFHLLEREFKNELGNWLSDKEKELGRKIVLSRTQKEEFLEEYKTRLDWKEIFQYDILVYPLNTEYLSTKEDFDTFKKQATKYIHKEKYEKMVDEADYVNAGIIGMFLKASDLIENMMKGNKTITSDEVAVILFDSDNLGECFIVHSDKKGGMRLYIKDLEIDSGEDSIGKRLDEKDNWRNWKDGWKYKL